MVRRAIDRSSPLQAEYFTRRHRAVSVDLRGHRESDKPQGLYPIMTTTTRLEAYLTKTEAQITVPGIDDMLQGGSEASKSDPYATEPPAGGQWLSSPPHIMTILPGKLDPAVFSTHHHSGGRGSCMGEPHTST